MRVRLAAAFAAFALAGCLAEEPAPETKSSLGLCPSWLASGEGPQREAFVLTADNGSVERVVDVVPANLSVAGRPVDRYRIGLETMAVEGGIVELRAARTGNATRPLDLYDYRSRPITKLPFLAFLGGANETGREYDVFLLGPEDVGRGEGAPIALEWRLVPSGTAPAQATIAFNVTHAYRVCGMHV
jgi:hypothetical protein